ncbi:MAG TPA: aminopeptidase [Phycisphaerae bacterium]|nr:aminopeptidase [Phycisphaerae bacterium]
MKQRCRRKPGLLLCCGLLCALLGLWGCVNGEYIARQAIGQLGVLVRSVPIEQALVSGTLSAEQIRKLGLIIEAREFARTELGLNVGWAFSLFHDTAGEPLAYNLSAAPKDSLVPKSWVFPIVGEIDYVGYFSHADAEQAEAQLQQQGYDTVLRAVDAYSTLGWLPDPVHSPLLEREDANLVEVVIHELAHNTVYVNGRSDFNESLATFIGRTGAVVFYERRSPDGQQTAELLRARYVDQDRVTAWFVELFETLQQYYDQDIPHDEKVAGREAVFQAARDRFVSEVQPQLNEPQRHQGWASLPTNNAWILLNRRYNFDLDLFQAVYDQGGGDFHVLLETLRAAARSADPWAHLREATPSGD